ncbi:HID-1 family protein [Wuchereria bancrofti]|uniref:HID-1 family protein n=1 Tax=Wuchereria bancrofti TaxID=6293 RepID=J9ETQ3_WUCBA|nr:HID-1 family protein [Wuchereria bancrofti]
MSREITVIALIFQEGSDDLSAIDSCEYIWEAGVGFATKPPQVAEHDQRRTEILKLFVDMLFRNENRMRWIARFTSAENRHVLPLFTSLLNIVCAYDPVGFGVPYNYLLFTDSREPLVQTALQVLIVCLDSETQSSDKKNEYADNFFINYLSRIHREEDFEFMLKGMTRLLTNPLVATYLPSSTKKITCHQELLVLLWKCCEYNQKFMFYLLKTSDVLEVLVPILFHISASRNDSARVGLIHMGVFIILLLSGERNFGVRLNKPYTPRAAIDVQSFTGTHADLLILVFHKLITTGNHRLQSLFDCLLTIIVNVSPYLKSISMVAANKLIHLIEAFSTPWFLFSSPTNHLLIFFLLEVLNNIIQYQFDGNSNLVYTIIRKRQVFYQLANLSSDSAYIMKMLQGRKSRKSGAVAESKSSIAVAKPVDDVENKTNVKATLAETPLVSAMTEKGMNDLAQESDDVQEGWMATTDWVESWKSKLPLQTVMRLLQVLVPQVEKICIDKGLTDESEILKFLQHGTLVGLLPVPHPILIRKYQANAGTNHWFRTYLWGVIYLRNIDPPIWYDTNVKLFEIQKA